MIAVDPADNSKQGSANDDAKNDTDAKVKIDNIYQQLKVALISPPWPAPRAKILKAWPSGGDIGFATEEELKNNGFPPELVTQFLARCRLAVLPTR